MIYKNIEDIESTVPADDDIVLVASMKGGKRVWEKTTKEELLRHSHDNADCHEDVLLTKLAFIDPGSSGGGNIKGDNEITINGALQNDPLRIEYSGYADFEICVSEVGPSAEELIICVDGKEVYRKHPEVGDVCSFCGNISEGITFAGYFTLLKFNKCKNDKIAYTDGFMTGEDKQKLYGLPGKTTDGGEIFGDTESNSAGSKGFKIIECLGKHGEEGFYVIDAPKEFADIIAEIVNNEEVYVTIHNSEWADSYSRINSADESMKTTVDIKTGEMISEEYIGVSLKTDYLYTNEKTDGTKVSSDFPTLRESIEKGEAELFICGHPELGTFQMTNEGVSFGSDNNSQGFRSFNSGYGNHSNGAYSHNFGKELKSGYATTNIGRLNDAKWAQYSLIAGVGNQVTKRLIKCVTMLGHYLKASRSYQVVMGSHNKGKSTNMIEVGKGSEAQPFNLMELSEDGILSTKEKSFPGQKVLSINTKNINSVNLVSFDDVYSSKTKPDKTNAKVWLSGSAHTLSGDTWTCSTGSQTGKVYFGYVSVMKAGFPEGTLQVGKKYLLTYILDIHECSDVGEIKVTESYVNANDIQKGETTIKKGNVVSADRGSYKGKCSLGKNFITMPFEVASDDKSLGHGIFCEFGSSSNPGKNLKYSLYGFALYEMTEVEFGESNVPEICYSPQATHLDKYPGQILVHRGYADKEFILAQLDGKPYAVNINAATETADIYSQTVSERNMYEDMEMLKREIERIKSEE